MAWLLTYLLQALRETREFQKVWNVNYSIRNLKKWGREAEELTNLLLDSAPEGRLQFEVKDVIQELDMMIHVTKSQVTVIKDFLIHASEFLSRDEVHNPPSPQTVKTWSQFKKSHDHVLRRVQAVLGELQGLQETAQNTSQSVSPLQSMPRVVINL